MIETMSRDQTCEERINEHLRARLADMDNMAEGLTPDGEPDEDRESPYEYGLGWSHTVVVRWDLSTGGPGDWFEFYCNGEEWERGRIEVERVEYHFNDWFDHAERQLTDQQEARVLAVAEHLIELSNQH